ncbi:hypothetical protein [Methanobrevibacter millerae]|uniref:Uncharacterized protein n=1 Tax=Methanobrevibacter millerae TaxID=230361 RepID=A0A1G5VQL8_9EURY|nr:hypothetical protein [Methanobrevibacter millerae]SDA48048.1 hypothetical protein SAMN02910315_00781 [Methanobrevibacter millerae]
MKIIQIIAESFKLPFKRRKLFLLAFVLALVLEMVTHYIYKLPLGDWTLMIAVIYTIFSLIIFGVILSLSNVAILGEKFHFDFKEHLIESIREYFITMYYLLISFFISGFFVIHFNFYSDFLRIQYFILHRDYGNAILSVHQLVHQLPLSMQIDLHQKIQLNVLIVLLILIFISSLGFIGKVVSLKSDDFLKAFDLRVIFSIIKEIGILRYLEFLLIIAFIAVIVVNILVSLESSYIESFVSAFLEVFVLFIIINAFYRIIDSHISDEKF